MKFVLFFSLALLVQLGTAQTGCISGDVRLQKRNESDPRIVGFVQYCYDSEWRTICKGGVWTTQEANVACGQLGYSDKGAAVGSYCYGSVTNNSVTINCNGGEMSLQECRVQNDSCPCTGPGISDGDHARAVCQPANCDNGVIRLVNGTTEREGRVEVCWDGRWGTVCSRFNREEIASKVCTLKDYPTEGALTVNRFDSGTAPVYNCTVNEDMDLNCVNTISDNCTHSMDLGVVCLTYRELYERLVQTINEIRQKCTEPPLVTTPTRPPTTAQSCACNTERTLASGVTPTRIPPAAASGRPDTTVPLGAVIGVLVALLVAIVIGWICTCVFLRRRPSSSKQKSVGSTVPHVIDNQHYSKTVDSNTATNYSSSGPNYESIDIDNVGGATYDVVGLEQTTSSQEEEHASDEFTIDQAGESEGCHDDGTSKNKDDFHNAGQHIYAAVDITRKKKRRKKSKEKGDQD